MKEIEKERELEQELQAMGMDQDADFDRQIEQMINKEDRAEIRHCRSAGGGGDLSWSQSPAEPV